MKAFAGNRCFFLTGLIILPLFFFNCEHNSINTKTLSNGYYVAEMKDFDSMGWKEFVSIYVNNGHIVTVEYNAKNISGFIKSWDPDYMREMNTTNHTYPNQYKREYAFALLNFQDLNRIDVVSGATNSYNTFISLANAVIEQARNGNRQIALVELHPAKESSSP